MSFTGRRNLSVWRGRAVAIGFATLGLLAAGTSCSSGPQPPKPGTPSFYWAAAREAYRTGDVLKTSENLQRILAGENEFVARARAWDTVISAGVAQAYIELADTWETGARANRANPTPFRKQVSALRSLASASAIQFTEDIHKVIEVDKGPNILLAFAYPAGAAAPPAGLKRVAGGILVPDSERDLLHAAMLQRGVLLSVCAALGTPGDAAAAQEKLKGGGFQAPRDAFLLAAAKSLSEQSELFTSAKLDQPNRLKMMSQEALKVLDALPQTKETKAVSDKVKARLKKAKLTL
jgi:hypothetical protein